MDLHHHLVFAVINLSSQATVLDSVTISLFVYFHLM